MSRKSIAGKLIYPVVVLGILLPALPILIDITQRLALVLTLLATIWALAQGDIVVRRMLVLGLGFASVVAAWAMAAKGYDSFFLTIVFSGLLATLAHRHFRDHRAILTAFATFSVYLVLYYIWNGDLDEALSHTINGEPAGVSRNFVGVGSLQFYLLYFAVCIRNKAKPKYWPIAVMVPLSIMSAGVSSTLTSLVLVAIYLAHRLGVSLRAGFLSFAAVVVLGYVSTGWLSSTTFYDRFSDGSFVVSRLLLWTDFLDKIDARTFLVGFPRDEEFIDHEINLTGVPNLHNSYLNLYKTVGIAAVFFYLLVIYIAVALWNRNRMLFAVYLVSLFRAATDGYYFTSFTVDFVLFYLFLDTPLGHRLLLRPRQAPKRPKRALPKQEVGPVH